jgi:CspA family cold shock protein
MQGTVKFFKVDKGYGFISTEDRGEYFFHVTQVDAAGGPLERGEPVEFELGPGRKGDSQAVNVRRIAE